MRAPLSFVSLILGLAIGAQMTAYPSGMRKYSYIPLQALAQPSASRPSLMEELNKEAASEDMEGIHIYSQDLVQMLVGNAAGPAYATSLIDRLTKAEFMARNGKRKLISEADIARAFNTLMKDTGAPGSLHADIITVHRMREDFESALPALISLKTNGSYCNPSEAVYVVEILIESIGRSPVPASHSTPDDTGKVMEASSGPKPPARRHLEDYFVGHSRSESVNVLNDLFHVFQI